MATYETKVILKLAARLIAKSDSVESAYNAIAQSAKDVDVEFPSFKEAKRG